MVIIFIIGLVVSLFDMFKKLTLPFNAIKKGA